ncbi:MAG: condensation domain-containing protein, partial [Cyclobacteriaceae bacterium]
SSKQEAFTKIPKVGEDVSYAISDAQRRLWVLSQFEGGSAAYNMPGSVRLRGRYDVSLFQRSFDYVIGRHEILRTVFREDSNREVRQYILSVESLGFEIGYHDFSGSSADAVSQAGAYIESDSHLPFDLESGPLMRASLLRTGEEEYVFYFNMHHIISDGWSMDVLSDEVFTCYRAIEQGSDPDLNALRIQYRDYAAWQLSQLESASYEGHRSYWLNVLSGELPVLDLPGSKSRPVVRTYNGRVLSGYLDKDITAGLRSYVREHGGSLFMVLLSGWQVLMHRYTSQEDLVIGTPVAGRDHADLSDQIGFYVNTLALRNRISPGMTFDDFFLVVKRSTLESFEHQMYPFDRLVDELDLHRDTSRSAVFDVLVTLQDSGEGSAEASLSGSSLADITDGGFVPSKFDLEVSFRQVGEYLSVDLSYNEDIYEGSMVRGLIGHFRELLKGLLASPGTELSGIGYLSGQERYELLESFNDTSVSYERDKTIVDLFEEQVSKTPQSTAVVFEDIALSYVELDGYSNQLAHYLKDVYGIGPDELVGIMQDRSEWLIISVLAVLKSGGAYVPIDPGYPDERISFIKQDTACRVTLDSAELEQFISVQGNYPTQSVGQVATA